MGVGSSGPSGLIYGHPCLRPGDQVTWSEVTTLDLIDLDLIDLDLD